MKNYRRIVKTKQFIGTAVFYCVLLLFSGSTCLADTQCDREIKKLDYLVYEKVDSEDKSLESEMEKANRAANTIRWRIPGTKDLERIQNCPGLRNQLPRNVYFWTNLRTGAYYKCFKINNNNQMEFDTRTPGDGAYGLLIETKKQEENREEYSLSFMVKQSYYLDEIAESFGLNNSRGALLRICNLNGIDINTIKSTRIEKGKILEIPLPKEFKCPRCIESSTVPLNSSLTKIARTYLKHSFFKNRTQFLKAILIWNGIDEEEYKTGNQKRTQVILYLCAKSKK